MLSLAISHLKQCGRALGQWRGVLLVAPTMAGLVIALRFTGMLQLLEWAAYDQFFQWRPIEPIDRRIVIVGINEDDRKYLKYWPMSDAVMARLLQKIKQQQPRAIGVDIYRDLPQPPGHADLIKVFETTPNLIGIEFWGTEDPFRINPSPKLKQQNQVGFVNVPVDADSTMRRTWLLIQPDEQTTLQSFSVKLAALYLKREGITPQIVNGSLQLGRTALPRFQANDGGYVDADDSDYQMLVNFRAPAQHFPTVSLQDVMEDRIAADLMRDRVVLIGATALSLKDYLPTPYSAIYTNLLQRNIQMTAGVEIQANIVSQLLSTALDGRALIQVWHEPLEWGWILLWSSIGALLSWQWRSPCWQIPALLLTAGVLVGSAYLAFLGGWWLPVVPALISFTSAAAVLTASIAIVEQQERRTVTSLFERHVTHDIAEEIWRNRQQFLQQGQLPGRRMTATVLFTDLKNFSAIAEHTDPEVLMVWLNDYLEAMAQIVTAHGGAIDKFIGDSVMAVFGVPIPRTTAAEIATDAQQAVRAAIAMATRLNSLNQTWQRNGLPCVTMRVGIATGMVITGSLGGLQKADYTIVGDCVNVAARLESYDKAFAKSLSTGVCRILINETTHQYLEGKFSTQLIDTEQLRGRNQTTQIYQVLFT